MRSVRCLRAALASVCLTLSGTAVAALDLSPKEQAWIGAHPEVSYGFQRRSPPISFVDDDGDGGFAADIMKRLSKSTGIRFRPLVDVRWADALEGARSGRIPMLSMASITPSGEKYFFYSEPLLDVSYGIFTRANGDFVESLADLDGKVVGVASESSIVEHISEGYPGVRLVPFQNSEEGLGRLAMGEYDAVVTNVGSATYLASAKGFSNLRLRAILPVRVRYAVAMSRSEPQLASIVRKAVASLPPEEIKALRERWFNVAGPGYTRAETIAIAGGIAAVVLLFAGANIVFLYLRLRARYAELVATKRQLQEYATIDELTGLGNRRGYTAAIEEELRRAGRIDRALAFLELDLDHFKSVNDRYGHEAGDRTLRAVADAIRAELRLTDQAFRVGGEEFVVLLPATDAAGAMVAAERFRIRIASIKDLPRPITTSIGGAVLPPGEPVTADTMFAVADAALYRAKAEGRNRVRISVIDAQAQDSSARTLAEDDLRTADA